MKQFDAFPNPFPRSRQRQPFLVTLQSELLARSLDTTVVAPLEPADAHSFADRLNPRVTLAGVDYVLVTQELVTVRKAVIGQASGSVADHRDDIIRALDLLFTGF
jgi:toxin CcdB